MATVLVVDDERPIVNLLRDVLEDEGYTVIEAYDGATALALARSRHPDLVLSDIMMPRMNGAELARTLLADPPVPHLTVILMSAAQPPDLAGVPVAAFLGKPFAIAAVSDVVAAHLVVPADADDANT